MRSKIVGRGQQNAPSSESFDHGGNDDVASIRPNRFGRRNLRDRPIIAAAERTNAQMRLYFAEMFPARFLSTGILVKNSRADAELTGNE